MITPHPMYTIIKKRQKIIVERGILVERNPDKTVFIKCHTVYLPVKNATSEQYQKAYNGQVLFRDFGFDKILVFNAMQEDKSRAIVMVKADPGIEKMTVKGLSLGSKCRKCGFIKRNLLNENHYMKCESCGSDNLNTGHLFSFKIPGEVVRSSVNWKIDNVLAFLKEGDMFYVDDNIVTYTQKSIEISRVPETV